MASKSKKPETAIKELPIDLEKEKILLAALMSNSVAMEEVFEVLKSHHLSEPIHQKIYNAIQELSLSGRGIFASALLETLEGRIPSSPEFNLKNYLIELSTEIHIEKNIIKIAETLAELGKKRGLIKAYANALSDLYDTDKNLNADDIVEAVEHSHSQNVSNISEQISSLEDALKSTLEKTAQAFEKESCGVTTGFQDLDMKIGGLHQSDLIVIGGRPSMGKTSLVANIALNAAKSFQNEQSEKHVLYFSLEMAADQLATRFISNVSGVAGDMIRKGKINEASLINITQAINDIHDLPLYIDDRFHVDNRSALPIKTLVRRARRFARKNAVGLIIVDYLHLLQTTGSMQGEQNRTQEISEIVRALQWLARDLNVPVIVTSQLSRNVEQREDKRPLLHDLRDSGTIEDDADIVLFLYRAEHYLSREVPVRRMGESDSSFNDRYSSWMYDLENAAHIAEVNVAKNRFGPTGSVSLFFDPTVGRFGDLEIRKAA